MRSLLSIWNPYPHALLVSIVRTDTCLSNILAQARWVGKPAQTERRNPASPEANGWTGACHCPGA